MFGGSNRFWLIFAARFGLGFAATAIGMFVLDPNGPKAVASRVAERP